MVCIKQADNIKVEDFRHHLVEEIARPLSTQDEVMRLRLHLLEPFDESENSSYVSHDWAKEKHYQAWIELMCKGEASVQQLFSSGNGSSDFSVQTNTPSLFKQSIPFPLLLVTLWFTMANLQ